MGGRKGKRERIGEGFAEGGRVETQEEHDEHTGVNGTNSNQIIKFNNILRLFTSVCFIDRKRKKLRRGVVCGNCFREWVVIQVSELFVFVLSASAITA